MRFHDKQGLSFFSQQKKVESRPYEYDPTKDHKG